MAAIIAKDVYIKGKKLKRVRPLKPAVPMPVTGQRVNDEIVVADQPVAGVRQLHARTTAPTVMVVS